MLFYMKKYILFLLFLLPISAQPFDANFDTNFDVCEPQNYQAIAERYERGLFFKISKCGVQDSYILGTMHSDMPQVANAIPRSVYTVLPLASSANFELKNDGSMQAALMDAMYYNKNSGRNLATIIGAEKYATLRQILAKNRKDLTEQIYARMKPWAVGLLMQVPPDSNDGIHLDLRLENLANSNKVPVFGLENVTEQLSIFTDLSEAEQIEFLQEAMDNYDITELMNDKLLSRYLEGDLFALQALSDESFDLMKNVDLKERLEKKLITERNKRMLERMQPRLDVGNAFIAVGALHLPSEQGLLKLLEQKGYYIEVMN